MTSGPNRQRTLDEFDGPRNAPDHDQCQGTKEHSEGRCGRVATIAGVVCSLHADQLDDILGTDVAATDGATVAADGGTSIPRRTGDAAPSD